MSKIYMYWPNTVTEYVSSPNKMKASFIQTKEFVSELSSNSNVHVQNTSMQA